MTLLGTHFNFSFVDSSLQEYASYETGDASFKEFAKCHRQSCLDPFGN